MELAILREGTLALKLRLPSWMLFHLGKKSCLFSTVSFRLIIPGEWWYTWGKFDNLFTPFSSDLLINIKIVQFLSLVCSAIFESLKSKLHILNKALCQFHWALQEEMGTVLIRFYFAHAQLKWSIFSYQDLRACQNDIRDRVQGSQVMENQQGI